MSGKVIMRRSSLETKYFKTRNDDTFKAYKKHKFCSRLYKKNSIEIISAIQFFFEETETTLNKEIRSQNPKKAGTDDIPDC